MAPAVDPLLKQLLAAARQRVDAQRAYYEDGRITIDRFIDAHAQLREGGTPSGGRRERGKVMAARKKFVEMLTEILNREQAKLQVGTGTVANVAEGREALEQAQIELNSQREGIDEYHDKAMRMLKAAQQRYEARS